MMKPINKGMGGHQSANMRTDTWLTPPYIIQALGEFDLDPCTPEFMPWMTARKRYTEKENGLILPWDGRVWLNPPYGDMVKDWMRKLSFHGNGVALIFARTETEMFFKYVWDKADGVLFIKKRIFFCLENGNVARSSGGAPSVLIAYGRNNADCLESCNLAGKFLPLNYTPIVVVGISPVWFSVVTIAIKHFGDTDLKPLYDMVERIASDKVSKNKFWKEKVRQQVYVYRKKKAAKTYESQEINFN